MSKNKTVIISSLARHCHTRVLFEFVFFSRRARKKFSSLTFLSHVKFKIRGRSCRNGGKFIRSPHDTRVALSRRYQWNAAFIPHLPMVLLFDFSLFHRQTASKHDGQHRGGSNRLQCTCSHELLHHGDVLTSFK